MVFIIIINSSYMDMGSFKQLNTKKNDTNRANKENETG